jgi:hypothetical protein
VRKGEGGRRGREREGEGGREKRIFHDFSKAHSLVNTRKGHGQFVQTKSFEWVRHGWISSGSSKVQIFFFKCRINFLGEKNNKALMCEIMSDRKQECE